MIQNRFCLEQITADLFPRNFPVGEMGEHRGREDGALLLVCGTYKGRPKLPPLLLLTLIPLLLCPSPLLPLLPLPPPLPSPAPRSPLPFFLHPLFSSASSSCSLYSLLPFHVLASLTLRCSVSVLERHTLQDKEPAQETIRRARSQKKGNMGIVTWVTQMRLFKKLRKEVCLWYVVELDYGGSAIREPTHAINLRKVKTCLHICKWAQVKQEFWKRLEIRSVSISCLWYWILYYSLAKCYHWGNWVKNTCHLSLLFSFFTTACECTVISS